MAYRKPARKRKPRKAAPAEAPSEPVSDEVIVQALEGYRREAEEARKTGLNPRDLKWQENLDLYWNRFDYSKKQAWQARETMPEVPTFVDRFAAAMKEALNSTPKGFYTVMDDTDTEKDIAQAVKNMTDVWLARVGRNQIGQCMDFSGVFEEQMKLGAIMSCAATVTWKEDVKYGRVAMETVDPQSVWLDPTYRNLYRVRRIEIDRHELVKMVQMKDRRGNPIFKPEGLARVVAMVSAEDRRRREELTGSGQNTTSNRKPVILDEYIATVVGPDGQVIGEEQSLYVVGNEQVLLRGPEANPYWHGKDWLLYAPLVTAPLSPYGRSYMEDFGAVAKTFNSLTNLLLDAVQVSTMKAFVMNPSALIKPGQVGEGIWPNKIFQLEEGMRPDDFFKEIDLGNMPAESLVLWEKLKAELREAAGQNEIALGQLAPNSRTSATEITETQQSTSALVRSIATTIETRWLNPGLDLVWRCGLQHAKADDSALAAAVGKDLWQALYKRRRELISRPVTFEARGISTLLYKSRKLRTFLTALQVIGSNDLLLKQFLQVVDMGRLVETLLDLFEIDTSKLELSERERTIRNLVQNLQQLGGQGGPGGSGGQQAPQGTQNEAAQMAAAMGVAR